MNRVLRVPWRLLSFGVAWVLAQGIAESVLGPLFGLLSRSVGETVPMYPFTMLIGVAAACYVALRFVDDVPWSVMALGDGAWQWKGIAGGEDKEHCEREEEKEYKYMFQSVRHISCNEVI